MPEYLYASTRRNLIETNATRDGGLIPFYQSLKQAIEHASGASEIGLEKLYQAVGALRGPIGIRARTLAGSPYQVTSSKGAVVFDSMDTGALPAELAFLKGLKTLLYQHELDLALFHWSFALKETGKEVTAPGGKDKAPLGISWLKAPSMSIEPRRDLDAKGRLKSYTRKTTNKDGGSVEVQIPLERLVVIREPSPYREIDRGRSEGDAVRAAAGALFRYLEFVEGHLAGGLLRDVLFSVGDPTGQGRIPKDAPEQAKNVLTRWLQRRRKSDKQEAQIVSALLEVHELGEGLSGLADKNLIMALREEIAMGLGVPFSLVQSSAASYATKHEDKLDLYESRLFWDMDLIEEAYNDQLLGPQGYALAFDKERIIEMLAKTSAPDGPAPSDETMPESREQETKASGDGQVGRSADVILESGF